MVGHDSANANGTITTETLSGLEYRNIGPHRGGRVVAVAGHPTEPMTFYFGACAGGLWKTTDGGQYWECISDGYFKTASVGALAVSDADPNVIYVGMGETAIRGNVSHGDGVYKTEDGGTTWRNIGLQDTRHISKVRVHPRNPDLVYVAALGHAWGPNEERGLFRSKDGGDTWEKILFRSDKAGAIDLSMDPNNPRNLYCAFWEAQRNPYSMWSGGEGSSLYKSTDGGDTWIEITRNEGLPKEGVLGKIGIAVSPAQPERVWALVEHDEGALFRSDNGGETWQKVSDNPDLRRRAWYYMHIFADPRDADKVWVLNLGCWKSIDGGANFTQVPTPHGDNHDLWIDPANSLRMIEGNDGGGCISFNGGLSWSTILNQPTAQFYHVTADNRIPYRLYGSQQDNSAISVPSNSVQGAITETEWFVPGGGESGYIAVRPDNPDIQYAGDHHGLLTRHDLKTGQERIIDVWPERTVMFEGADSLKYRFNWTFPIFVSPFDPNTLYTAGNLLFRSTDEGSTWEAISPDLTRNDPSTLGPSGGPITRDNTSAEFYGTIFAALESPHERGTFWVGSDDGLLHISHDNGQTWQNITPQDLPEWSLISIIDVSPHDAATAYMAATRYKHDDAKPYLYKTSDYGATWTAITNGIPEWDFTRVIREDPGCRGLLFSGTETGLYVSFDDGANWESLQTNLPVCPIHDLIIKDDDLVVGTHGRSFWILDDITPLRQIARDRQAHNRLFTPAATIRMKIYEGFGGGEGAGVQYRMAGPVTYGFRTIEKPDGTKEQKFLNAGKNRPNGIIISYYLTEEPGDDITLTILDEEGNEVQQFSSKREKASQLLSESGDVMQKEDEAAGASSEASEAGFDPEATEGSQAVAEAESEDEGQEPFIPKKAGLNRFVWNFRCKNATKIPKDKFSEFATAGPAVPPGTYGVRLAVGGETFEETFQVLADPRISTSQEDLVALYEFGLDIRDTLSRLNEGVMTIRDVREQVETWEKRLKRQQGTEHVVMTAKSLRDGLTVIEEEFINTKSQGRMAYPPPNVPTRLNQKLAMLGFMSSSADAAPTRSAREVYELIRGQIDEQLHKLDEILAADVPAFNDAVRKLDVPAIVRTKTEEVRELALNS